MKITWKLLKIRYILKLQLFNNIILKLYILSAKLYAYSFYKNQLIKLPQNVMYRRLKRVIIFLDFTRISVTSESQTRFLFLLISYTGQYLATRQHFKRKQFQKLKLEISLTQSIWVNIVEKFYFQKLTNIKDLFYDDFIFTTTQLVL